MPELTNERLKDNSKSHPKERAQIYQPVDPSYRLIALTRGYVATVDTEDYEWLAQWNWHASSRTNSGKVYARRTVNSTDGAVTFVWMHKAILSPPEGFVSDHIDRDTLNNRRGNLRPATKLHNSINRSTNRNSSTGFKGVSVRGRRFEARITVDGVKMRLGVYSDPETAHAAYRAASIEFHGEFSCPE